MARRKKCRNIIVYPTIKKFVATGETGYLRKTYITLEPDEYQAIVHVDNDGMSHQSASEILGVSRPTFSRIVENARLKIATALTKGCSITINIE